MGNEVYGALGLMVGIFLVVYFLIFAIAIAMYILNSIALFKLAKGRGIKHRGLAWVPIGSSWLLGKLADDVNLCRRNKKSHYARNLLILDIAVIAVSFFSGVMVSLLGPSEMTAGTVVFPAALLLSLMLLPLVIIALSVVLMVFFYMALYRVFYGYDEENSILYLILSIFLTPATTVLLFIIRNRELLPPDPSTFAQNGFPNYTAPVPHEPVLVEELPENNEIIDDTKENTNE